MKTIAPHLVQYQGSKRILAPQILRYLPNRFLRLIEPFSGTAAMTIATALSGRTDSFWVNDLNEPLVGLLRHAVNAPDDFFSSYSKLWEEQFSFSEGHIAHFYHVRDAFNSGDHSSANMMYLLARCVKGSVRYGRDGKFNQSLDKRRHGTSPKSLMKNLPAISRLLKGRTRFSAVDYREVFKQTQIGDVVYMDPPYQGVSDVRDQRYFSGLSVEEFALSLDELNRRNVDFLVSYDGTCGAKGYGVDLPCDLGCRKVLLNAGLSSQALLLGRRQVTYEALYISRGLQKNMPDLLGGKLVQTEMCFQEIAL